MSETNPFTGKPSTHEPLSEARIEGLLPLVIPASWERAQWPIPAFACVSIGNPLRGLAVLFDAGIEADEHEWMHVSCSRPDRNPSWEDCVAVKRLFIGDERYAYQVIPPGRDHYNLGKPGRGNHVLHLWARVDGASALPDFLATRGGTL